MKKWQAWLLYGIIILGAIGGWVTLIYGTLNYS